MRFGNQPASLMHEEKENKAIGFTLTSDFCAEHEIGSKTLREALGMSGESGLKGYTITKGITTGEVKVAEKNYLYVASYDIKPEHVIGYIQDSDSRRQEINGCWDSKEFLFFAHLPDYKQYMEVKKLFDTMAKPKNTVMLASQRLPVFDNGSWCVLLKEHVPKEVDADFKKQHEHASKTEAAFKSSGLEKAIEKKDKEYMEKWGCNNRLFHPMALSPRMNEYGKLSLWMNPNHQHCVNSGWYSVEDIKEYLEGKKAFFSPDHYRYLELTLRVDCDYAISHWNTQRYTFQERKYIPGDRFGDPILKLPDLEKVRKTDKLPIDFVRTMDSMIKWYVDEYSWCWRDHKFKAGEPESFQEFNRIISEVDQRHGETMDRSIGAFLQPFVAMGYLYRDAVNTPENHRNASWWNALLRQELKYDAVVASGIYTDEEMNFIKTFKPRG